MDNIIFFWVMHEQEIIQSILDKLDITNCEVKTISLIADESSIRNRIQKDILKGIRTEAVMEKSIARIPLYLGLNTIKIDTSNKEIKEIVKEIEEL